MTEQRTWLPTEADFERIRPQQKLIADEVKRRYGVPLTGGLGDLEALQCLINDRVYSADQTYELQSIGLCVGEVMFHQLGFHWIMVEDEYGRDPAIRLFGETSIIVFPLTMISKRVERGETVDLRDLYGQTQKALPQRRGGAEESS
jgi:hypothetical protein